jgi:hypothetical protein
MQSPICTNFSVISMEGKQEKDACSPYSITAQEKTKSPLDVWSVYTTDQHGALILEHTAS